MLRTQHADRVINIWGHTDPDPIKRSAHKDNFDLGFKRAHAVYSYFAKTAFTSSETQGRFRLHTAGEHSPLNGSVPSNKTEKAKCRRVVLILGDQE